MNAHFPDHLGSGPELAKWGFVREDWKNTRIRPQNNARLETADEKPMFRDSFRARHCLVIADSFNEHECCEIFPRTLFLKPDEAPPKTSPGVPVSELSI